MKQLKIFIIVASIISIISCESNTYQEVSVETTNPTYVANIKPIMTSNCISCHSADSQFPNLETYDQVKDAIINGNLICRIDNQSCGDVMPTSGRMQQPKIDLINLWVINGFIQQ